MNLRSLFRGGGVVSLLAAVALFVMLIAQGVSEELRVGSVEGRATMAENGSPLPGALIILSPMFDVQGYERQSRAVRTDADGRFAIGNLVAGAYRVYAYTKAHSLENAQVLVGEGQTASKELALEPSRPYLDLYMPQHVFTPKESPGLHMRGFAPEPEIDLAVYRVEFSAIIRSGALYNLLSPISRGPNGVSADGTPDLKAVSKRLVPISTRDAEGIFDDRVKLPPLEEGIYWVRASAGARQSGTWIAISRIALVTKTSPGQALAYVCDLETGRAVPGAEVSLAINGRLAPKGLSGPDGLVEMSLPTGEASRSAVVARMGASTAICNFYKQGGGEGATKLYAYTDRPVYRPGDRVYFKGVVRTVSGANYALPPTGMADVEVRDPANTLMFDGKVPVDGMGALHGSFNLTPEVVGDYEMTVRYRGTETARNVTVAAYRKPEFRITVTPERPFFIRGDAVRMRVKCEYYFGGPVAGAKLTGAVYRRPVWEGFDPAGEDLEYEEDPSWLGDYAGDFDPVVCDENGEALIEFDPRKTENPSGDFAQSNDAELVFEVSATESEEHYFDGRGSARLVRGEFDVRAGVDRWVCAPGETTKATIRALDHDGKPLANVDLSVVAAFERWTGRDVEYVLDQAQPVRTNAEGVATFAFTTPAPGAYRIRATGRDRRGNRIDADAFVYVWRDGAAFGGPSPNVELMLDRPSYRPGGSAKVLVRSANPGGNALVTVEGDRVYWRKVVVLTGATTAVDVPVTTAMAPNVYASVAFVSGKEFREASRRLKVDLERRRLTVKIVPDREVLRPGETLTYAIATATEDGQPVPADVSLGVVDESIYAIREDREDPLAEFYPRRYQAVNTNYSFPELYLDGGDKGPANMEVRRDFRDTAFWSPTIRTDASGRAEVAVSLPDNLGSWRATATAFTADTRIGKATASVRARRELMVRLQTPTLVIVGDAVRFVGVVNNDTGADRNVQVQLSAKGVDVEGARARSVEVRSGKAATLEWILKPRAPGVGVLTLSARAGGFADAVEGRVPIRAHGRLATMGEAGSTRDRFAMTYTRLPGSAEGELTIGIAPSLATSMLGAIDGLVDYPYGCTEQTMSRFIPAVVVARTLRDLGLRRPELEAKIPDVVARSLVRLRTLQRSDGGFGWFGDGEAEPELTALVLEGLWRSSDAGQAVDAMLLKRTLDWAREFLKTTGPASDLKRFTEPDKERDRLGRVRGRAAVAYAVSLHVSAPEAIAELERLAEADMDAESLAILAIGAQRQGRPELAQKLLDRLLVLERLNAGGISWAGGWGHGATARALEALVRLRPNDPTIPKVVWYLTAVREGDGWTSTRDTGQILVGLSAYLRNTRELLASGVLRARLNGTTVLEMTVSPGVPTEAKRLTVPMASLREGENAIAFEAQGGAMLYYTVSGRQIAPEDRLIEKPGPGLRVGRTFHTLEARRIDDGSLRLLASLQAATAFQTGQPIRARIRLFAERDFDYVIVEAPTPSGTRVSESDDMLSGDAWWSGIRVLDDRVALFIRSLPKGEHWMEYNLRAEASGAFSALPATAFQMYAPSVAASSAESVLRVDPR